jgi:magnesium transporter
VSCHQKEEIAMRIRLVKDGIFTELEHPELAVKTPADGFYWIDASVEDLEVLQPIFHLHELAVEDCLSEEEQRPKIEIYEKDQYFIVMNSIRFDDEEIFLRALNIFLGKHYIITVTQQKINEIRALKPKLLEEGVNSADTFLYHLIDLVIDNYFTVSTRIEAKIELLEEDILIHYNKSHLNQIVGLRSEILWLKKVLSPQKDLIATLNRKELKLIDPQLQKYFGDVYENAVKVYETFDTLRDLMANLREAYQSAVNTRANDIMRIFTALTTIFMPLTFITGIYGMNFKHLPGMGLPHSEYVAIGLMVALAGTMVYLFKKKDWL